MGQVDMEIEQSEMEIEQPAVEMEQPKEELVIITEVSMEPETVEQGTTSQVIVPSYQSLFYIFPSLHSQTAPRAQL